MVLHLISSLLISALLPLAILIAFILMKLFGVDANIVALSGIAIAIGTMVDTGIVLCENILSRLKTAPSDENKLETIYTATTEVSGAVMTAVLTTIVSFLPVFALQAAEGRLFKPLAYTKTFSLMGALIVSLILIPPATHFLFRDWGKHKRILKSLYVFEILAGTLLLTKYIFPGLVLIALGTYCLFKEKILKKYTAIEKYSPYIILAIALTFVLFFLAHSWLPLGVETTTIINMVVVGLLIAGLLYVFKLFQSAYPKLLAWCLDNKALFLVLPTSIVLIGGVIWSRMGEEFMPQLDEGSFLYMPTTMPHASIGEALDVMQKLDLAVSSIPEVELTVGKLGRVDSSLDPAPISMFENIINYKPEYIFDENGKNHQNIKTKSQVGQNSIGSIVNDHKDKNQNGANHPGKLTLFNGVFTQGRSNRALFELLQLCWKSPRA